MTSSVCTCIQDREEIFEVPPEGLNVGQVAELLALNTAEVVKALFLKGVMAQVNQQLDIDTCLLYTSPSPRDRQKSRMPSSA